jgi:hypothetical protein
MTSIFPIAYGMSKFVSGVLGARFSPSVLLAGGLMATALINIAFGFGTSLAWFCFFWALNGTLQVGWEEAVTCWGQGVGLHVGAVLAEEEAAECIRSARVLIALAATAAWQYKCTAGLGDNLIPTHSFTPPRSK